MANGTQQQTDRENENAQMLNKDNIELKLIVAYLVRKEPANSHLDQSSGGGEAKSASPESPEVHSEGEKRRKRKKKKKKKNILMKLIFCIQPTNDDHIVVTGDHRFQPASYEEDLEGVVNKLTNITDSVHFLPGEIESDSDDIVEKIVELLREHGDKLNDEIEKNAPLMRQLQASLSYGFFEKVARAFTQRLNPEELPCAQSRKSTEIALTCEVTRRLNVMDRHPMNRVLGFGAKYLQDYFTPWVNSQGGYEEVFTTNSDAEEEIQ